MIAWMSVQLERRRSGSVKETSTAHLCVRIVTPPVRSYARLTTEIPDLKVDVFVCHSLDVEANCYVDQLACWRLHPCLTTPRTSLEHSHLVWWIQPRQSTWSATSRAPLRWMSKLADKGMARRPRTCSLYSIVVFPAESSPTINIRTSLSLPQNDNEDNEEYIRDKDRPMLGRSQTRTPRPAYAR